MNTENNGYTILYASIMVIIVAIGLAFTHQVLSEKQIHWGIDRARINLRIRQDANFRWALSQCLRIKFRFRLFCGGRHDPTSFEYCADGF